MNSTCILVINCGSSSLKYDVYKMPEGTSLCRGTVERIGDKVGSFSQSGIRGMYAEHLGISDMKEAFALMIREITHPNHGGIHDLNEIKAVGHRVVHGGEDYASSVLITSEVLLAIETNIELAPLHNPLNLTGIQEAQAALPELPQIAVFDTAFHQSMPPMAYLYGLPRELYEKHRIRRYGFHGTSHRYVACEALAIMKRARENTNLISCHLGNGASVTAIYHGESVDTSMGFTPLEGLIMGTRSGDVDPSIILWLLEHGYSLQELNAILNKKSGLLGMSGISNDLRDLEAAAERGDQRVIDTLDAYAYRIRKYIGGYMANLVKASALIFTGGIGQYGVRMRERICHRLENIGIMMDYEKNRANGASRGIVSHQYSPVNILVIPANEELQIARDAWDLISDSGTSQ